MHVSRHGFSTQVLLHVFSYAQIIHAGLSVNLHYEPLIKNKTDDVELLMADPDSLVSQTRVVTDNSDVSRMWKGWSL